MRKRERNRGRREAAAQSGEARAEAEGLSFAVAERPQRRFVRRTAKVAFEAVLAAVEVIVDRF